MQRSRTSSLSWRAPLLAATFGVSTGVVLVLTPGRAVAQVAQQGTSFMSAPTVLPPKRVKRTKAVPPVKMVKTAKPVVVKPVPPFAKPVPVMATAVKALPKLPVVKIPRTVVLRDAPLTPVAQKLHLEAGADVPPTEFLGTESARADRDLYVLLATQKVEGGYDAVNLYDRGILSWGLMQWSAHENSLQDALWHIKGRLLRKNKGRIWSALFKDQGIDVQMGPGGAPAFFVGGPVAWKPVVGIENLRVLFRGTRTPGRYDTATVTRWAQVFARAGRNPVMKALQNEWAVRRLQGALDERVDANWSVRDFTRGDLFADAVYFAWWTNNPAASREHFRRAVRQARLVTGEVNPARWPAHLFPFLLEQVGLSSGFGTWPSRTRSVAQTVGAGARGRHEAYVQLASRGWRVDRLGRGLPAQGQPWRRDGGPSLLVRSLPRTHASIQPLQVLHMGKRGGSGSFMSDSSNSNRVRIMPLPLASVRATLRGNRTLAPSGPLAVMPVVGASGSTALPSPKSTHNATVEADKAMAKADANLPVAPVKIRFLNLPVVSKPTNAGAVAIGVSPTVPPKLVRRVAPRVAALPAKGQSIAGEVTVLTVGLAPVPEPIVRKVRASAPASKPAKVAKKTWWGASSTVSKATDGQPKATPLWGDSGFAEWDMAQFLLGLFPQTGTGTETAGAKAEIRSWWGAETTADKQPEGQPKQQWWH